MSEESTKQKILDSAGPIFAKNGYQKATVRDISEAAGVNLASINYYFGDKEKLYTELLLLAREKMGGGLSFPNLNSENSPTELLERFVTVLLRKLGIGEEPDWQIQLLVNEFLQPSSSSREIVEGYFRPYFESLLEIIDQLAGTGLNREDRLRLGFSVIGQCLHYRLAGPMISMLAGEDEAQGAFGLEKISHHIARFSIAAICGFNKISEPNPSGRV
ncbi:MAG: CerR family C-terminal domain-containing protein [Pirellulaceae bacterium]|jgi:TetR/AcrR family transcriptional regulator, regulator of cefoperazone and chloramphenicol sensitivity|nr:CerR family C-terminal domain-containing protein [Pirellulaceae bacterium]